MYLKQLSDEQKELFLDVCIQASLANNIITDEEKHLIQMYCEEMQLANVRYEVNSDLNTVISRLIEISSKAEIKIITLEITALIISDKKYDEFEQKFMNDFIRKIGLSNNEYEEIMNLLNKLTTIYNQINNMIFKD